MRRYWLHHGEPPLPALALRASSDIPRQVGLGGSSALILALLRALHACHDRAATPLDLAAMAWKAETRDLGIVAGPDGVDPHVVPAPLGDPASVDVGGLRVAWFADNGLRTPTPETVAAVRAAVRAIADAGATVEERVPDDIADARPAWEAVIRADGFAWLWRLIERAGTPGHGSYDRSRWVATREGEPIPGDGVSAAGLVTQAGRPVVLFTSHTDEPLVDRARSAGVVGFLLKPLRPAELAPALDLAIARFAETRRLRQLLEERKLIERAKGSLMMRLGLTEDEAFRRLRRAAMDSRRPMADIARALLVSETVARP